MNDDLFIEIRKPEGTELSGTMLAALEQLAIAMASEAGTEVSGFSADLTRGGIDFGLAGTQASNIVWCGGTYSKGTGTGGPKCSGGYLKFP